MNNDRPSIPAPRPTQFVVGEDEHGIPKLDVVEGSLEQTYRVGEHHSVALFLALSRKKGLLPYRRARQREGTVCVRATLSEHDALWSEFLELNRELGSCQLAEVTRSFLPARGGSHPALNAITLHRAVRWCHHAVDARRAAHLAVLDHRRARNARTLARLGG